MRVTGTTGDSSFLTGAAATFLETASSVFETGAFTSVADPFSWVLIPAIDFVLVDALMTDFFSLTVFVSAVFTADFFCVVQAAAALQDECVNLPAWQILHFLRHMMTFSLAD